jgi:c-di-GMP-binding flagellar brake protein YcgR
MSEQKTDTRRYARFEMFEYALVYVPSLTEPVRTVVVDIGLGGLQLRSRGALPAGEICVVHVGSSDGRSFELRGEVRYSTPMPDTDIHSTGIRFLPDSHEDRVEIAEYVHAVFQRQSELANPQLPMDL